MPDTTPEYHQLTADEREAVHAWPDKRTEDDADEREEQRQLREFMQGRGMSHYDATVAMDELVTGIDGLIAEAIASVERTSP